MEGLFAAVELEDQLTDRLRGTRLQRIEVWNWGRSAAGCGRLMLG
jgi:hypothetical protein